MFYQGIKTRFQILIDIVKRVILFCLGNKTKIFVLLSQNYSFLSAFLLNLKEKYEYYEQQYSIIRASNRGL